MSYYHPCPRCGANLDPGELCDCGKASAPDMELARKARRRVTDTREQTPGVVIDQDAYLARRWKEYFEA